MLNFLVAVQLISVFFVILLVLLHSPKGEGLASIGGSSQMFKSVSSIETGLNIVTGVFAAVFLLSSAALGWGLIK